MWKGSIFILGNKNFLCLLTTRTVFWATVTITTNIWSILSYTVPTCGQARHFSGRLTIEIQRKRHLVLNYQNNPFKWLKISLNYLDIVSRIKENFEMCTCILTHYHHVISLTVYISKLLQPQVPLSSIQKWQLLVKTSLFCPLTFEVNFKLCPSISVYNPAWFFNWKSCRTTDWEDYLFTPQLFSSPHQNLTCWQKGIDQPR